jgi:hypothetical protein
MAGADRLPLAYRVAYPPRKPKPRELAASPPEASAASDKRRPQSWQRPALLSLAVETGPDQALTLGAWLLSRYGRLVAGGLILPDKVEAPFRAEAQAWAKANPVQNREVRAQDRRTRVDGLHAWRQEVLHPYVTEKQVAPSGRASMTWFASWDAAWTWSRLAYGWAPAIGKNYGGFSLQFFDDPRHPDHDRPRLILRALGDDVATIKWGTMPPDANGKTPRPGPVLDLGQLARSLAGNGVSDLATALRLFELSPIPEVGNIFDRLVLRVGAIDRLARALFAEADFLERRVGPDRQSRRPTGIRSDPRMGFSTGSTATGLRHSAGISPLAGRVIGGEVPHDQVVGAFMAAQYGPRAEVMVARTLEPCTHWDTSSTFGHVGRLYGASAFMTAAGWRSRDVTEEARAELGALASSSSPLDRVLDPAWWRKWLAVAVLIEPRWCRLPARTPYEDGDELVVRYLNLRLGDGESGWWMFADVVCAILGGEAHDFTLRRAVTVEPHGTASGLCPVTLPGGTVFDPATDDIFERLTADREACRSHSGWTPTQRERRTALVKGVMVSLASGNPARVDLDPMPAERDKVEPVVFTTPEGERQVYTPHRVREEPGPDWCPVIASTTYAGARLLSAIVERLVADRGGRVFQTVTDAYSVPADIDMAEVAAILQEKLAVPLRPQHGTEVEPVVPYIMGRNRYSFFRAGKVVHTSEFGLGGTFCDPTGSGDAPGSTGARAWVEVVATAVLEADDGRYLGDLQLPEWGQRWAVSPFRAANPTQLAWLSGGARPFDQALIAHTSRGFLSSASSAPVARALWTTPPEAWPALDWRDRAGHPMTPRDVGPEVPLGPYDFRPQTIGQAAHRLAVFGEPGKVSASPSEPLHRGRLQPVALTGRGRMLIGRDGAHLSNRAKGVATPDEGVVVYVHDQAAMTALRRLIVAMLPAERKGYLGLAERTGRAAAAGRPLRYGPALVERAYREAVLAVPDISGSVVAVLERWAERLERCRNEGCAGTRDTRSLLCKTCRKGRSHHARVA